MRCISSLALYHKYSAARNHFVNFLHAKYGRRDLMPSELTHLIIHDFEIYLKTVVSLRSNSATKTLKFFKTVVIFAQKCGVMTVLTQKDTLDLVKGQVFVKFMLLKNHLQRI